MEAFDIEHDHTDAQCEDFAAVCGCPKCDRYRTSHTAPTTTTVAIVTAPIQTNTEVPAPRVIARVIAPPRVIVPNSIGIVHTPTAPSAFDLPRNERPAALQAQVATLTAQLVEMRTTMEAQRRELDTRRTFVAGARDNAAGVFCGFEGSGPLTRAELLALLEESGAPANWAPPALSAHAHAGRAIGLLNARGYVVRSEKAAPKSSETLRTYQSRWIVAEQVGNTFPTCMIATLGEDNRLTFTGAYTESLGAMVAADFDARVAGDIYPATKITEWLTSVFVNHFCGVTVGSNWYVRAEFATAAERLCATFATSWGKNWLLPAVPMIASDELSSGIVNSFTASAMRVIDTYRKELAAALAKDADGTIGAKRATTLLGEIRELTERAAGFAAMFGDDKIATIKKVLTEAGDEIQGSTDGISIRFANIFDEIARDAARS